MPPQAFWQAVAEFNQQQYYACHDTLEALWLDSSEPDKRFYQGVLQVAVACYHLQNCNWRGAVVLMGEGLQKLSDYQPVYQEIDVTSLITTSYQLLQRLQQIQPEQIREFVAQIPAEGNGFLPVIVRLEL